MTSGAQVRRAGLDYFRARYYEPNWGRFTSPDWSATPEAVPYANLANPQSLNLYTYVQNNPVTSTDRDGHICFFGLGSCGNKPPPTKAPPAPPKGALVFVPMGSYRTLAAAGIAAVKNINPESIKQNIEYAGTIAKSKGGGYGYLPPLAGTPLASARTSQIEAEQPLPPGAAVVADYHTHAAFDPSLVGPSGDGNEVFSPADKDENIGQGIPGFLGTPRGAIKEFIPSTGAVIVLVPAGPREWQ